MKRKLFRWCLAVGLVATIAAALFAPPAVDDGVMLSERVGSRVAQRGSANDGTDTAKRGGSVPSVQVLSIHPRMIAEDSGDESGNEHERSTRGFSAMQWTPPLQRQVMPTVPPLVPDPPRAPPLPFQFMGKYVEGDQVTLFLKYNDQSLVARVGDVIANHYKVESLQSGTLTLVYMPLNQMQTLDIGSKN